MSGSPQPPPPPPPSTTNSKTVLSIIVASLIVVAVVAGVYFFALPALHIPGLNNPNPEITMVTGHEGLQGLNYVYYVDATVKNNGVSGWIALYAEINGAGRYERQDTRIYLGDGESQLHTFTFDISVLGTLSQPSISYKAWATP